MTTATDVLKMIKEKEVKYVDFRFCDTRGKEQHVTVPRTPGQGRPLRRRQDVRRLLDRRLEGHQRVGHDPHAGSAATAVLDPFFEDTTLNLRCDIIEPATMQGYERDPRSLGMRAEAYLKSTGIADGALFGPENEFFIFDSVKWHSDMNSTGYTIDSVQGAWNSDTDYRGRQPGPSSGHQGRLLPGAAGRCLPGHPQRDVQRAGGDGPGGRSAPPRSGHRRPVRDRRRRRRPGQEGRRSADPQVRDPERGRTATARRRPSCRSRWSATTARACTCTSRCRRTARRCSPATSTAACPTLALYYIGGIIKHAKAINAFTNPGTNSYKRLVPGFEAPVMLAYSARNRSASIRIPWVPNPKARRIEVRFPDSTANPYLAFAAMMMAGLDGIQNKIHPGEPADKDLYDLEPEEEKHIPQVCHSLDMALEHLDKDRELPQGRWCVHRRRHRCLHGAEDAGSHALPHEHASMRARHVLQHVGPLVDAGGGMLCLAAGGFLNAREMGLC